MNNKLKAILGIVLILMIITIILLLTLIYTKDNKQSNIQPDEAPIEELSWDDITTFTIDKNIFCGNLIFSSYVEDQEITLKLSNAVYALYGYLPEGIKFIDKRIDGVDNMDISASLNIEGEDVYIGVLGNTAYMKYLD